MTNLSENAQLALDTINRVPTQGIPICTTHIMEHSVIEHFAGTKAGSYVRNPHEVYVRMLERIGVCMVDQYIADNPLSMGNSGYEDEGLSWAAPVHTVTLDGIVIDTPETVVEHLERFAIPHYQNAVKNFDFKKEEEEAIRIEYEGQRRLGANILKAGYGQLWFPYLTYTHYSYENYFMAFALYPEVLERHFAVQADYCALHNSAVVSGYIKAGLPLYGRLDHDIADSRGLLTGIKPIETYWLPHFERAIRPAVDAGFRLLWHCDGNLMELFPPLIECGVNGFQGFQYEDGMDYKKICAMKDRNGENLVIIAGISVTRELPMGTPADVKRQADFLVEHGPRTGLFLGFSSSCVPGTPLANIETAIEAMQYYWKHGRKN